MLVTLHYDYVPDVLTRRTPFRDAHLAHAREWHAQGKLRMAGAYDPPSGGALFVFDVASAAEVETFVAGDPYVKNGVVTGHRVRPWNVVVGA
ncbi:MAG TPA: YciI family protein [Anaeromyxobacter sp.]